MQQKNTTQRSGGNSSHRSSFSSDRGNSSGRTFTRRTFGSNRRSSNNSFAGSGRKQKISGSSIDIAKLVQKAKPVEEKQYIAKNTFADFDINQHLKDNVLQKGYMIPTAIQDQAIEHVLAGRDVIGLANTGTGKTAAFLLPLIDKILKDKEQKVLIVAPTRELALQIQEELIEFTKGLKIFSAVCIGGANIRYQIMDLRRNPHIIIGTPGRLKDLIDRDNLRLTHCENIVMDEADRMLDMGFVDDMTYLLSLMPEKKQVLLFSATMSKEIQTIVHKFQKDPITISVRTGDTSQNVDQDIIRVSSKEHKMDMLHDLLVQKDFQKVIIFGKTKHGVERIEDELRARGFTVASIHGDKTQMARQRSLRMFKEHKIQALIATDVAARGLDIPNVSHVINFDIPATYEDYTHRIGRTGRAGKAGKALTFVGA
jgi:ATP-dependent RNA helicase RhlE